MGGEPSHQAGRHEDRGDRYRLRGARRGHLLRRLGQRRHLRGHRRAEDRARSARARSPSTSRASRSWSSKNVPREAALVHHRPRRARSAQSEVVFIAVGTPEGETGDADLQYVLAAARADGQGAQAATRSWSTRAPCPVGTADKVREAIAKVDDQRRVRRRLQPRVPQGGRGASTTSSSRTAWSSAPTRERAREDDGASSTRPFVRTENPILYMDPRSRRADQVRGQRDARHAHLVHERHRAALREGRRGRGLRAQGHGRGQAHRLPVPLPRRGLRRLLLPQGREGAGRHRAATYGIEFDLLRAVERTNERQKKLLRRTRRCKHFGDLAGKHFAVWGLAFKPKTDDMREAPVHRGDRGAARQGRARSSAHDPVADEASRKRYFGDRVTLRRRRPTRRSRARTRSSSSPSGTSSATRTSSG